MGVVFGGCQVLGDVFEGDELELVNELGEGGAEVAVGGIGLAPEGAFFEFGKDRMLVGFQEAGSVPMLIP